jgi:anti-anti-sigma regulatory factor
MSELIISVERLFDHGAYVIHAAGPLGAWNRHDLRRAVQKCLVDLPTALILHVDGLQLLDRLAAGVFVALRYDASQTGPGIRALLCGVTDARLRQRIRLLQPQLDIYATVDDAIKAIYDRSDQTRWLFRRLGSGFQAPLEASAEIVDACQSWEVPALRSHAATTAFDLGLGALRCPPGPISLTAALHQGRLRIGLRVESVGGSDARCTRRRPLPNCRHQITQTGHILWISLPKGRPKPTALPPPK